MRLEVIILLVLVNLSEISAGNRFADICGRPIVEPDIWPETRGQVNRTRRAINGGTDARPGSYPYYVWTNPGCGGSVISDEWVLTAAHCYREQSSWNTTSTIQLGWNDLNETAHPKVKTGNPILHPAAVKHYTCLDENRPDCPQNIDIALLKLIEPLEFSDYLRPVCLPPGGSELVVGQPFIAVGLGGDDTNRTHGDRLQQKLALVSQIKCGGKDEELFCTDDGRMQPTNNGDSGGPLLVKSAGKWYQIGAVHAGAGGGSANDFFTKVSAVCDWIEETTGEDLCAQEE